MNNLFEDDVQTEQGISFTLKVSEDPEQHDFVAQLWGRTPPLNDEVEPGQPTVKYYTVIETPDIRSPELGKLEELCLKRIEELGGPIKDKIRHLIA